MKILYATDNEGRFLKSPKFCIGQGAKRPVLIEKNELIVLFGSCGGLKYQDASKFIIDSGDCRKFYTVNKPLTDLNDRMIARLDGYAEAADMETQIISKACKKAGAKFFVIKYITDYCGEKVMPKGINHFWRIYQHWKMTMRFNKMLSWFHAS